jgi:raffinose/stachyose/melibiose transport system permease protein
LLAYIISRKLIRRGIRFFQSMIFLPYVISPIIIGVLFNAFILNRTSVLIEVLGMLGFDQTAAMTFMMHNPMVPVLAVILWMFTGFYMIIFIAHMSRIDPEIIEAARIDGAGEGKVLRRIVLPLMRNEIVTTAILAISGSLRTFDLIYAMTRGGPAGQSRVLSLFMFESAFQGAPNYPLANAISTIMVLISIALIIIVRLIGKFLNRGEADRQVFH